MNSTTLSRKELMQNFLSDNHLTTCDTLEGHSIIVSVINIPPMVTIVRDASGKIETIEGYLAEIWFILQNHLNFRSVFIDASSEYTGDKHSSGTLPGILEDLWLKRADVALVNFGITSERLKVADFSVAIDFDSSKLLMFSSSHFERIDWTMFLQTLSWQVWCSIAVLWIIASVSLAFVSRRESHLSYCDYIFFFFGALTMQGCENVPGKFQGRLIFLSYWIMCVVLYASFTALLTTKLTTATYKPLSTLKEALDHGFHISVAKGTMQHESIIKSGSADEDLGRVLRQLNKYPDLLAPTIAEGIQKTYNRKTLFLYDSSVLRFETFENCSFTILNPSYFSGYLHFAYRKNFPHEDMLDNRILLLMSTGILRKLASKWLYRDSGCSAPSDEPPSLSLAKTLFAFAIIIGGVLSSVVLLICENFLAKMLKKRKRKKSRMLVSEFQTKLNFTL